MNIETAGKFHTVFDRASLVAFPETQRSHYADRLLDLMEYNSRMLLISLEYDQSTMKGPPFSVPREEVERLFSPHGKLELLESCESLEDRMRLRGLTWMFEHVYLFERS